MMNAKEWFERELASLENDPDFLTEELLLDITEQIYVRMEELGVRPAELARRLGVSRPFVSQLLNGKPNMTMRTLVGVAHALNQQAYIKLQPRRAGGRAHVPSIAPDNFRSLAEKADVRARAA